MGFTLVLLVACLIPATANDAPACDDDACQWENGVRSSSLLQARGNAAKVEMSNLMDLYTTNEEGSPIKNMRDRKCIDHNYGNDKVFVHSCHDGLNQMWYLTSDKQLKNKYGDKCLDYNTETSEIYMGNCHKGDNQKWYFNDRQQLVSEKDAKCVDYNFNEGTLYMHSCHSGKNQQFYFDSPKYARSLKSEADHKCMDYDSSENGKHNVYAHPCHAGQNQKWYFTADKQVKNQQDEGKCLDLCTDEACDDNVYMSTCHDGANQKWSFDKDSRLVSDYNDGKMCLDYHADTGNYYAHTCHGGANQKFYFEDTKVAVKISKMNPTFAFPEEVKCDMRCLHFSFEKSDTEYLGESAEDQTMCPKLWMIMATPEQTRWATWDDPGSECENHNPGFLKECPSEEEIADAGRVTNAHFIFDEPGSDDCETKCFTCPTFEELLRLPDPYSEDDPGCDSGCEIDECTDGTSYGNFVPCCVKRKEIPCHVKKTNTPKSVYSLNKGVGLDRLVDLMKSAMIDSPPQSAFLAGWLGELKPILGEATVLDMTWPGTHDTGTYDLSDIVSKHAYTATDAKACDFMGDVLSAPRVWCTTLFSDASNVAPEFVRLMGQAQSIDIIDQLNGGIRFFDFRIDFTHTGEIAGIGVSTFRRDAWFVMHGTQTKHPAIFHLAQMKAFLERNPDEIIIIYCSHRGSFVDGENAWPGAELKDRQDFWDRVKNLFGELLFDHSLGSLGNTPIHKMLERNQRVVWYSNDWVDSTSSSNLALNANLIAFKNARSAPGGNEPIANGQRDVFGDSMGHNGPEKITVFSNAAVIGMDLMYQISQARKTRYAGAKTALRGTEQKCATLWQIPSMGLTEKAKWCPMSLLDAGLLVNYYNQEVLEEAYQDPDKNFPHVIHIDVLDRGGLMRVGTKKIAPLGEAGEYDDGDLQDPTNEEGEKNREAAYPFSATLVGKNIQRLCKGKNIQRECAQLKKQVEEERGDDPVKAWNDPTHGRYKCFSDVYEWQDRYGEKPC